MQSTTPGMTVESMILNELRLLQSSVDALSVDTKTRLSSLESRLVPDAETRLSKLETITKPLFDNGRPGRCTTHELRLRALEDWRLATVAGAAVVATVVSVLFKAFGKG